MSISELFFQVAEAASAQGILNNVEDPTIHVPPGSGPVRTVGTALSVFVTVVDFMQVLFWTAAVGFSLYAAFLYLFSQGSTEKIGQARKMMIYTVVAIVLALVAYGLPAIVANFIDISTGQATV